MADSNRFGPYHDPNVVMLDNIFMSDEPLTLEFPDYGQTLGKNRSLNTDVNSSRFESTDNQLLGDYSHAGPSGFGNQTSGNDTEDYNPDSFHIRNPIQLSVWPVPPMPYTCTCCQVLREIFHTKGVETTTKLEIHGRLGMISHGILEICSGGDTSDPNKTYKMFDFCKESLCSVKQFLVQYCEKRKQAGYTMMKDPLLTFYEALCVGLDWDYNFDIDDILQGSPVHLGESAINQPAEAINQVEASQPQAPYPERRPARRPLAAQRARAKNLRLKDFVEYFHLPVEEAAERLGVCSTVIKRVCRSDGLERWPYRKIKSIEKQIEEKGRSLNADDPANRAAAEAEIQRLRRELHNIYFPVSVIRNNT